MLSPPPDKPIREFVTPSASVIPAQPLLLSSISLPERKPHWFPERDQVPTLSLATYLAHHHCSLNICCIERVGGWIGWIDELGSRARGSIQRWIPGAPQLRNEAWSVRALTQDRPNNARGFKWKGSDLLNSWPQPYFLEGTIFNFLFSILLVSNSENCFD